MTVNVNNTLNGAGGGASAADVAAAVAAALPTQGATQAGQVAEFAAGQVPAGYAQIAGADSVSAGAWEYAWPAYSHGLGVATQLYSAGGKLVALAGSTTPSLQVLNDDYTVSGGAIALPYSYATSYRLTPLASGKLLRIGGAANSGYTMATTYVQTFDPLTRSVSTLAAKPTAVGSGYYAVEAGNGEVFGFTAGTAQIDRFSNNVWTENVITLPAAILNAEKLPSGKLLFICAATQYIFNPAAPTQFVAVAVPVAVAMPVAAATSAGVRVFDLNATRAGLSQTMLAYDYNETAGAFLQLTNYARTSGGTPYYRPHTTKLKDGGILIGGAGTVIDALIHRVSYTPQGIVKAVKL